MGAITTSLTRRPTELQAEPDAPRQLVRNAKGLPVGDSKRRPGEPVLSEYITARDMRDDKARPIAVTEVVWGKLFVGYGPLEPIPAGWVEGEHYVNFPQRQEEPGGQADR